MPIPLSLENALGVLPNLATGLEKYLHIMSLASKQDFHDNQEFRKRFNGFYRVRRSTADWQPHFYALMGRARRENMTFPQILVELHRLTGRVEASFASTLYGTLNADAPVIDRFVLQNLGLELPAKKNPDRLEQISGMYQELQDSYGSFIQTAVGQSIVNAFNERYTNAAPTVTPVKAIDLILWQTR